jgi:hypothetical protein
MKGRRRSKERIKYGREDGRQMKEFGKRDRKRKCIITKTKKARNSSSSVALQSLKGPWPPHTREVSLF